MYACVWENLQFFQFNMFYLHFNRKLPYLNNWQVNACNRSRSWWRVYLLSVEKQFRLSFSFHFVILENVQCVMYVNISLNLFVQLFKAALSSASWFLASLWYSTIKPRKLSLLNISLPECHKNNFFTEKSLCVIQYLLFVQTESEACLGSGQEWHGPPL